MTEVEMSFDGSIGAFMLGTIFAVYCTGVTTTQAFSYYRKFPNDRPLYFWLVTVLLFIDVFHTAISCYTVYYWCVTIYGQVELLYQVPWAFAVDPALTGIAASLVQVFYAYRVYLVGARKRALPIIILGLSAIQCGFAFGATIVIFNVNYEVSRFHEWTYGVTIWLISSAVTDIIITGTLVVYLRRATANGEHIRTNSIVRIILRNTIETNGLTCVCAIVDAALFLASSQSYHVIVNLSLTKLYFNSLLVSLNSREKLSSRGGQMNDIVAISEIEERTPSRFGTNSKTFGIGSSKSNWARENTPGGIIVTMQETIIDVDEGSIESEKEHPFSRTLPTTSHVAELGFAPKLTKAEVRTQDW